MAFHLALAVALASGGVPPPELCADMVRETEPDMQIHESDLDAASAASAAEWLREKVSLGMADGEFHHGALNKLRILEGHVMREQALADLRDSGADSAEARESRISFCKWLATEGCWYD